MTLHLYSLPLSMSHLSVSLRILLLRDWAVWRRLQFSLELADCSPTKVLMVYRVAVELTLPLSASVAVSPSFCLFILLTIYSLTRFYFSCPPLFPFLSNDSTEQSQLWSVYFFLPQCWYSMGDLTCRLGRISSIYEKVCPRTKRISSSSHQQSLLCDNLCHRDLWVNDT